MERLRTLAPSTTLKKVRLGVLVYALTSVLPQLVQVNSELSTGRRLAGSAALILLATDFVVTYARDRAPRLDPLLLMVLLFVAGTSLPDPPAVIGMTLGAMTTQSLYGSVRSTVLRILALAVVIPATMMFAPAVIGTAPPPPGGLGPILVLGPAFLLAGVLVPTLHIALVRHDEATARERLLAQVGGKLLNRTDANEVHAIASEAATTLSDLTPGVGMLIARCDSDDAVVERVAGLPDAVLGTVLPRATIEALRQASAAPARGSTGAAKSLNQVIAGPRHWRVAALTTADAQRYLLLGSRRVLRDDAFTAFQTLATQWSLAVANCGAHTELTHRAHHDLLTALPNRALFFQQLTAAVDTATSSEPTVALLVVDLDDFKQVNDGYGHAAGDQVLVEVADRLRDVGDEHAVPARFGGDEFAMLLSQREGLADAVQVAEQLRERLLKPIKLTEATVLVGASIGVAVATPGLTAGDLLRCADIAMYSAKARGKNRVEPFTEKVHGEIAQHRVLEEHLGYAIERGEIFVHYQPQIDMRTGRCVGVEALARWRHPTLGMLPASDFTPLAARIGQIVAVGTHVLRIACRQAMTWSELTNGSELSVAVNVAPQQVTDPEFVDTVRTALDDSGLPAHRLTLEITESELIDEQRAHRQLEAVAELGARIAIDNFGTGYASLASLRSFPVHQLKIDPSFLSDGDASHTDEMFQLVVSMGKILDLETVAEGVQTEQQRDAVERAGVPLAQGYVFAQPMPAEQIPGWLAAGAHASDARLT